MAKILNRCPVCEGTLNISELACKHCNTQVRGSFEPCRFCRLTPEHLAFIETFLRCEGNLSRVEKELGVSYPTVRNRLSVALAALHLSDAPLAPLPPEPPTIDTAAKRREVLDALSDGRMNAEEAAIALRELP
jgi:hypothetical protein